MNSNAPKIELFTLKNKLAADSSQTVDVLLRVTPPEAETAAAVRPHLNLSLALDRSGSMEGAKMQRAREAAAYCVDQLLPTDRLSVVIFDDVVETLIPSQTVENKWMLKNAINGVTARNSTALHEAWVKSGLQVSENLQSGGVNRVLLITDGQANVGETNVDRIVTQAGQVRSRGVSTSTIGIGADFNEDLLMPMAEAGGGNAWHVEEATDMQRIFAVELEGLLAQTAHTVSLNLIPADGVTVADVLNDFEKTETGGYRLPNLQTGAPLEIVVQLRVGAQTAGTTMRLLDARLDYTPQNRTAGETVKSFLETAFADAATVENLPENQEVERVVRLLMNARARREAMKFMDAGDYAGAQNAVQAAFAGTQFLAAAIPQSAEVAEELAELQQLGSSLANRADDKMSRKQMAYQSYSRTRGKK